MKSVAAICKQSKQRGNALVLLLLLKTWDGKEAPDLYALADLAHISPRQAERDLTKLIADGEAEKLPDEVKGRGHVTRFRLKETTSDVTDFKSEEISTTHPSDIPESTTHLTDLSPEKPDTSDVVLARKYDTSDGTPIAPYSDIRTSTDNSSASLQNHVGLSADGPTVEERARALRKAIAGLPKHKRCAQPSPEEWATILDIFGEWRREVGKNGNAKLTPERGRAVLDRLRSPVEFTREDFSKAIKGCRASPHHMGENDTSKLYNDLELICRSDQNLERFIGYLQTPEGSDTDARPNRPPAQQFGRPPITRDFSKFPRRAG